MKIVQNPAGNNYYFAIDSGYWYAIKSSYFSQVAIGRGLRYYVALENCNLLYYISMSVCLYMIFEYSVHYHLMFLNMVKHPMMSLDANWTLTIVSNHHNGSYTSFHSGQNWTIDHSHQLCGCICLWALAYSIDHPHRSTNLTRNN